MPAPPLRDLMNSGLGVGLWTEIAWNEDFLLKMCVTLMALCGEEAEVTGLKSITFKRNTKKKQQPATIGCTSCWQSGAAASFSILSRWLTGENDCYQPSLSSVNTALGGRVHWSAALTKLGPKCLYQM